MSTYLGDGVYCEYGDQGNRWRLWTSNGETDTNVIFLEPQVAVALMTFLSIGLTDMGVKCDFRPREKGE